MGVATRVSELDGVTGQLVTCDVKASEACFIKFWDARA
jgi:hypothetical protein